MLDVETGGVDAVDGSRGDERGVRRGGARRTRTRERWTVRAGRERTRTRARGGETRFVVVEESSRRRQEEKIERGIRRRERGGTRVHTDELDDYKVTDGG